MDMDPHKLCKQDHNIEAKFERLGARDKVGRVRGDCSRVICIGEGDREGRLGKRFSTIPGGKV
jgi:hypothetical protein